MTPDNDPNVTISITLPKSQVNHLDRKAAKTDSSRSRVIRALIRKDQLNINDKSLKQANEELDRELKS